MSRDNFFFTQQSFISLGVTRLKKSDVGFFVIVGRDTDPCPALFLPRDFRKLIISTAIYENDAF